MIGGWQLRVRDKKGKIHNIDLAEGENTSFDELKSICGKLTKIAKKKVIIKIGHPPSLVVCPEGTDEKDWHLSQTNIKNHDLLVADRQEEEIEKQKQEIQEEEDINNTPTTTTTTATTTTQIIPPTPPQTQKSNARPTRSKRIHIPGEGIRLGSIEDEQEEEQEEESPSKRPKALFDDGKDNIATVLAMSVSSNPSVPENSELGTVLNSLKQSFQSELKKVQAEQEAIKKVAAALSGAVEFKDLNDGTMRMKISYHYKTRQPKEECVQNLPPVLLSAVLTHIASDTDTSVKENLDPRGMAMTSPRIFWSVVRHGNVGPEKSFIEALNQLTNNSVDWESLLKRESRRPEKYKDYVSH